MTIYAVFDKGATETTTVVADRFSWFAAILPPIFALAHGLWPSLLGYLVLVAALVVASRVIGGGAAFWTYVAIATWIGFEAPAFRRAALRRRGWSYRSDVIAAAEDLAELEGVKARRAR